MAHDDAVYQALLDAMRFIDVGEVVPYGKADRAVKPMACPQCAHVGKVRYIGSVLLEGSLSMYHLTDTEVEHHFRCEDCQHTWHLFKML